MIWPVGSLLRESGLFAGRSVRRFVRTPETLISTVVFPVILFLAMLAVFGSAVEAFDDSGDYAQRLVLTLIVSGLMFGSIGTATGFLTDLQDGLLTRVRSMPLAPAGPMIGAAIAETARAVVAVVVLVAVGTGFGFRFDAGVLPTVAFGAVALLAAISIVWVGLAMASVARSYEALAPPLSALFLLLLFFSRGLVPLEAYPGWAQPIVRANPATAYVTALDRLARGGALIGPLLNAVGWSLGLIVVFGLVARRAVRRRSGV